MFLLQMITLGGDAELELVDSLDPFSEGVVFSVRPPKKSWKNIANLSGGEKVLFQLLVADKHVEFPVPQHILDRLLILMHQTLSSLALVFALHHYKPTPLYVMDEIDAALGTPLETSFHPFPYQTFYDCFLIALPSSFRQISRTYLSWGTT